MLEVKDLVCSYGKIRAVKGISFSVSEGQIVTLLGPNGAGKTTTLKTICGLIKPSSGTIAFKGQPLHTMPSHKIIEAGIGLAPEGRQIFGRLTVMENLKMGAFTRKDKKEVEADLDTMFQLFPRLKERLGQLGGTLSGGEQQMLCIARALMSKPQMLLLDEPSLGLAPLLVEQIFSTIAELHRRGITILLVEQNARMALSIADYAVVLETGELAKEGKAEDIANDPAIRRAYLGEEATA